MLVNTLITKLHFKMLINTLITEQVQPIVINWSSNYTMLWNIKQTEKKKSSSISNFIMCKIFWGKKNVAYYLDDLILLKYNGTRSLKEKKIP